VNKILNYLRISDALGTAGQPAPEQFADIRAASYQVLVNLALLTSSNALPNERELVTAQGMEYVHLPVVWEAPTPQDLEQFFGVMERYRDKKVFVHCAMNYRVSSFVFLYRVMRLGVPPEVAQEALRKVWEPNATWKDFIERSLARAPAERTRNTPLRSLAGG